MEIINDWLEKNLNNYITKKGKTIPFEDSKIDLNEDVIDHIVDWMKSDDATRHRKRLFRLSVPDAYRLSILWARKLQNKFKKIKNKKDQLETVDICLELNNGFFIVKLKDEESYLEEGNRMGHCVGSYHSKSCDIYSLRDKNNEPHCTIEIEDKVCRQIKGKANKDVVEKYHLYVKDFLNTVELNELPRDLRKINCYNIGDLILHKDEKVPREILINKNFSLKYDKMEKPLNKIEINGDFNIKNYRGWKIIADEIIVHGDLLIDGLFYTTRLCNSLKVMGDVEIVDASQLRALSLESDIQGNVYVEECKSLLSNKIKCLGELEIA